LGTAAVAAAAGEVGPEVGVVGLAAAAATGVGAALEAATGALVVVVVVAVGVPVAALGVEPSVLLSSVKATLITNSLPSAVFFSPLRPFFGRPHARIPQNRNLCCVH